MHLLVIDIHYLVALEAEQVLGEALGCTVEIGMPSQLEALLEAAQFRVCIMDASLLTAALEGRIQRLLDAGAGFVFTSVESAHRHGVPGFAEVPVVLKPFDDEKLLRVVAAALD